MLSYIRLGLGIAKFLGKPLLRMAQQLCEFNNLEIRQEIPAHFDKWAEISYLWANAVAFFGEGDEKA